MDIYHASEAMSRFSRKSPTPGRAAMVGLLFGWVSKSHPSILVVASSSMFLARTSNPCYREMLWRQLLLPYLVVCSMSAHQAYLPSTTFKIKTYTFCPGCRGTMCEVLPLSYWPSCATNQVWVITEGAGWCHILNLVISILASVANAKQGHLFPCRVKVSAWSLGKGEELAFTWKEQIWSFKRTQGLKSFELIDPDVFIPSLRLQSFPARRLASA